MTRNPQPSNRTLYHGDNLPVLRGMDTGTIDLIATDPPFNSERDFHAEEGEFQDRWRWDKDVHQQWVDDLSLNHPRVFHVIEGSRLSHSDNIGAFLCFMAVRLLEMKRVMKPTGCIYLHCDPTASHYLKELMDAVFGVNNFRNEIVWQRIQGAGKSSRHGIRTFGKSSDAILFYSKSNEYVFNASEVMTPYPDLEKRFPLRDEKGVYYRRSPFRPPGLGEAKNLYYEYKGVTPPNPSGWVMTKEKLKELDASGELEWVNGKPHRKQRPSAGIMPNNVWVDIPQAMGKERVGYPTQKPLALYERIIKASSNAEDVVLDPFCGCATTCVAAERLGRQWIGIDIWKKAPDIVLKRLQAMGIVQKGDDSADGQIPLTPRDLNFIRCPEGVPDRTDEGETAVESLSVPIGLSGKRERVFLSNQERKDALAELHGIKCQGCGYVPPNDGDVPDIRYLVLDHIDPRSQGGKNVLENLTLLCPPCNSLKRDSYTIKELRVMNAGRMKGEVKDIKRIREQNEIHKEKIIRSRMNA